MAWTKYFKQVNSVMPVHDSLRQNGSMVSRYSSWLPEVYQGPSNRLQRYVQYEQMDFDHEVHAALNTIAEFSTQEDEKTKLPFLIHHDIEPTENEVKILQQVLKKWCRINQFRKRIYKIFRSVLKYGDQFFIRDPETMELFWIDPSTVEKIQANESNGKKIEAYYIKDLDFNLAEKVGTNTTRRSDGTYGSADSIYPTAPLTSQANYMMPKANPVGAGAGLKGTQSPAIPVDAKHVVHLSLSEGMDESWPFGTSELEKIFKIYKQKELIEEALLIYRVHRAPERRVFQIDVGGLPPNRAQQYLQKVKDDIQQRRIPSKTGGGDSIMDASYNPMSILEDYYFAVTSDGRGSKVETLPGGENLGQIDDVKYFSNKMMRALGIPSSYLPTGPEDSVVIYNDGKISAAFIQEYKFQQSCKRLQAQIIDSLDQEFKVYLKNSGYMLDTSTFNLSFTEPQGFSEYREIELNSAYANVFSVVNQTPYISKRFALKKYLGWSEAEILENERLLLEEKGMKTNTDIEAENKAKFNQSGISPGDVGNFSDMPDTDTDMADPAADADVDSISSELSAAAEAGTEQT